MRLGVLVNPIAGMGGRLGLHGTDGAALAEALEAGAAPVAGPRMRRTLDRLASMFPGLEVPTASGSMGAALLPESWIADVMWETTESTTAADTRAAAVAVADVGIDLLLFGGGDGTAVDIAESVADRVPVLGVPCGVKMHSAVFATSPEAAADVAARYLRRPGSVRVVDVLDANPSGISTMAVARVPAVGEGLQRSKSGAAGEGDLAALGRDVASRMVPGRLYLLGPGTTVAHVAAALGVCGSALGVDVVLDGRLIAADACEAELLALLADHDRRATLVLGVVGGQGFLLGRGNQQLSPAVVAAVGPDNIEIIASSGKLAGLDPPVLRIDVDDPELGSRLSGFRRVRTAPHRSTVMRVVA